MPPIISKKERVLGYIIIGSVDALQFILDLFVVTEFVNHFIDVAVGVLLGFYAVKRKLLTANKTLVLIATFAAEQVPFVNALPFWTYDLHNLYKGTLEEQPPVVDESSLPLYQDGVRRPTSRPAPVNSGGQRLPPKV